MRGLLRWTVASILLATLGAAPAWAVNEGADGTRGVIIIMKTSWACAGCLAWEKMEMPFWEKDPLSKSVPLRKVHTHEQPSEDIKRFITGLMFTPEFIVVRDGRVVGRFLGIRGGMWDQTLKLARSELNDWVANGNKNPPKSEIVKVSDPVIEEEKDGG